MAGCKGVPKEITAHGSPDAADWRSAAVPFSQEDQSGLSPHETISFIEAEMCDCVMEKPHQVCTTLN